MKHGIFYAILAIALGLALSQARPPETNREKQARRNVSSGLMHLFGCPVFIRIIKETRELELWLQRHEEWQLLKIYPIAAMSGELGPKEAEGDCQAPEGFYRAVPTALNPHSNYYLAFNIGYPNSYDLSLGRTGSYIMIHGSNVSIGCFAMTDPGIEEIYTLVAEAFRAGQKYVPVQIYPFRMTPERMQQEKDHPHYDFWQHLYPGWQHTEERHEPWADADNG